LVSYFFRNFFESGQVAPNGAERYALACQAQSNGFANAFAAATDECILSCEIQIHDGSNLEMKWSTSQKSFFF